jgi:RNA recognition motif-containing protein
MDAKILKQVEFYFGDANLPRDKFLKETMEKNNGWVPIATIASFTRMKAISEDLEVITQALSAESHLIELDEEKKNIRRKIALPEDLNVVARSVIVEGFPKEMTLDEIIEFLSKYAAVEAVRMQRERNEDKVFRGIALVVLKSEEDVEKLVNPESPISLDGAEKPLSFKKKEDKKRKEAPVFVFGRLLKLEAVPEAVKEVEIKLKLKQIFPAVAYVKRLPEGLCVLFTEPIACEAFDKLTESPVQIGEEEAAVTLVPVKVEDQEEEKRIVQFIESTKPGAGGRNKRRR